MQDMLGDFFEFCRERVSSPMCEAIGRAWGSIFGNATEALLEAVRKKPRDYAKDAVLQYLVSRNGGNVEKASSATIDDGHGGEARIVDILEQQVLEFIQRYGWTGRMARGGLDETRADRVSARMGNRLATAVLAYEAGVARILLDDLGGLRYLLGDRYGDACRRLGIPQRADADIPDLDAIEEFANDVLPTFVRHLAKEYTDDGTGEWDKIPGMPAVYHDFSYMKDVKSPDGKKQPPAEHMIDYAEMKDMVKGRLDVPTPALGSKASNPDTAASSGCDYDIYYIPNNGTFRDFHRAHQSPPIYMRGFSCYGDESGGPWCTVQDFGWNNYVRSRTDSRGSLYVLLRKRRGDVPGWNEVTREDALADIRAGKAESTDPASVNMSAICLVVDPEGQVHSCCGRRDHELGGGFHGTATELQSLLGTTDLLTRIPCLGEIQRSVMNWWLKNGEPDPSCPTSPGAAPAALPTPNAADNVDREILKGINRKLMTADLNTVLAGDRIDMGELGFVDVCNVTDPHLAYIIEELNRHGHESMLHQVRYSLRHPRYILILDVHHPRVAFNSLLKTIYAMRGPGTGRVLITAIMEGSDRRITFDPDTLEIVDTPDSSQLEQISLSPEELARDVPSSIADSDGHVYHVISREPLRSVVPIGDGEFLIGMRYEPVDACNILAKRTDGVYVPAHGSFEWFNPWMRCLCRTRNVIVLQENNSGDKYIASRTNGSITKYGGGISTDPDDGSYLPDGIKFGLGPKSAFVIGFTGDGRVGDVYLRDGTCMPCQDMHY